MSDTKVRVSIAVLTYRRVSEVTSLLPLLVGQAHSVSAVGVYEVDIIVIDNDPEGSARAAVVTLAQESPLLRYVMEPIPGISAARNRALDEAHCARLLVFIDDDEHPGTDWLAQLLNTWAASAAAAVAGPVLEEFATTPDPWIVSGEFFRRRSMPTGTSIAVAGAGNLLLDLEQVEAAGVRFDPRFGLSGGEDTLFCRQLTSAGRRIVWCEEAYAMDRVPAERISRRWVLLRGFSHGNSDVLVDLQLAGGRRARVFVRMSAVASGLLRIGAGTMRCVFGLVCRSARHQARGLRTASRGTGMLSGATGWSHEEYRRDSAERSS